MNYIQKIKEELQKYINVEDDLLDLYTLLVLIKGKETTWKDVHDAWAVWKNKTIPDHKSLIPFEQLTPEIQQLDDEYTKAIIKATPTITNLS